MQTIVKPNQLVSNTHIIMNYCSILGVRYKQHIGYLLIWLSDIELDALLAMVEKDTPQK